MELCSDYIHRLVALDISMYRIRLQESEADVHVCMYIMQKPLASTA